jgi:GNAT superfamily N-acetyltransferase
LSEVEIRRARPDEYAALGDLTAHVYQSLPGMPQGDVFQAYFDEVRDVAGRAAQPGIVMLVAARGDELLGGVTFCEDLKSYGAPTEAAGADAAGFRFLVVGDAARGLGLGRALTEECLRRARALGRQQILLHTTEVMPVARAMYERMGFQRAPELDFGAGDFTVMGFRLKL